MEQATIHGPFEVVEDPLHQRFTVRGVRRPVILWVTAPLVLVVLTMLVAAVFEVERGRYSAVLALFLGALLLCGVMFITVAPFIWPPGVSVSREQLVLRSWRGERRFSTDEFHGFQWEHIPPRPKSPAYVRLWARCKRGPSRILFHVVADGDEQALLRAAEFVVRGLEHAMTGRPPERKGSRRRGAPSSD